MLVIRVELWPKGNREERRLIGDVLIENVGKVEGTEDSFRYAATFVAADTPDRLPPLHVEHVRRRGFWRLVSDVLNGALVKREESMLGRKGG